MLYDVKNGQTSVVLRVKLRNSSVSTGAGLTGLTSASSGLKIGTIADNEATSTAYTVAGSTIESITTLGTYAAPTATKCRFKEVDATNHPGLYEVQLADARFAVASAKSLTISFSGATNLAECDVVVPLRTIDPYVAGGKAPATVGATDYSGNTVQTGDSFARIGALGAGLTALAPASTALSTAQWTNARATALDNLDVTVSSRLATAGYTSPPSAATVANLVWDTVLASHATAGSTGAALSSASSAGDPWSTALPGSYAAGTAGNIVGNRLDAAVSTRSTLAFGTLLSAPRSVDGIADGSLTVNDALWCAIVAAAGKESISGTTYTVKTPSTGTVLRTFTLDSATAPASRT